MESNAGQTPSRSEEKHLLRSGLVRKLRQGANLANADLLNHIIDHHGMHTGFTEDLVADLETTAGKSSYEILLDSVPQLRDKRILDLACGSGPFTKLAANRVGPRGRVVAMDLSFHELLRAQAAVGARNAHFARATAVHLPLRSASVDAVFSHLALMVMPSLEAILSEVSRVLCPGGTFATVIEGIGNHNAAYDQFSTTIEAKVRQEMPSYPKGGFADGRLHSMNALAALLSERFGPGIFIARKDFDVHFAGQAEEVAERALRFFYSSYLLTEDGRQSVKRETESMLRASHPPNSEAVFSAPHTLITVRKQ